MHPTFIRVVLFLQYRQNKKIKTHRERGKTFFKGCGAIMSFNPADAKKDVCEL